ncbi:hypothetical protein EDD11_007282 [Mortierella claussenii]|nr:hypothetical protein EDD11_007282 [Mortierella claussenii]
MYAIIRVTSALAALVYAVQAVPLERHCRDLGCLRSVSSGIENVGSTTNIVPVTNVMPITRYQPYVKAYAPIVDSACDESLMGQSMYRSSWWADRPYYKSPMGPRDKMIFESDRMPLLQSSIPMTKRSDEQGEAEKHHHLKPECVPSATESCEQTLTSSTTDLGSEVVAKPKNVVLPSTMYQSHVQDKAAEVYAAEAQHTMLSHQNVNLGSNTFIQPITKVVPTTTYQPSVDQKATKVEAAAPQDLSLARSSVSLGSTVTIRPVTTVEPSTIYQPKIESLPFIIHDETGCESVQPKEAECSAC